MSIIENRKAFHEYFIEQRIQAGIKLEGWEVKAISAVRLSLQEAYVFFRDGAFYLRGSHVSPLPNSAKFTTPDPTRPRKLLMNQSEINKWAGKVIKAGYTVMPLNMHYHRGMIKIEIGLAKGKKLHDKRATERERDVQREVQRAMKGDM
jgi:SsrA-binding protein